jgi:hypothetical protein
VHVPASQVWPGAQPAPSLQVSVPYDSSNPASGVVLTSGVARASGPDELFKAAPPAQLDGPASAATAAAATAAQVVLACADT